jgi:hypothetical protein
MFHMTSFWDTKIVREENQNPKIVERDLEEDSNCFGKTIKQTIEMFIGRCRIVGSPTEISIEFESESLTKVTCSSRSFGLC